MSRLNSKLLVLDASLAKGSNDAHFNPQGSVGGDVNRRLLIAVWEEGHVAVFNRQLRREWSDHAGDWVKRTWLRLMENKGLTRDEEGAEFSEMLGSASRVFTQEGERAAFVKDLHLIQSALATGQLILSNELRFPRQAAQVCQTEENLKQLHYGNPAVEGENCRLWIKAGAEKEPERRIDVWAASHC
jgi:hypothetical protein